MLAILRLNPQEATPMATIPDYEAYSVYAGWTLGLSIGPGVYRVTLKGDGLSLYATTQDGTFEGVKFIEFLSRSDNPVIGVTSGSGTLEVFIRFIGTE